MESREAEQSVGEWFKKNGYAIIPSYEYSGQNDDKAPKMQTLDKGYPVPDLDVSREGYRFWVEVKRYTYAPFNRKKQCYVHGIPSRLYNSYKKVEEITGCPVFLAIEEKKWNRLLIAKLSKLKPLHCQCGCRVDKECKAPIKNGIYFDTEQFKIYESTIKNYKHF